MADFIFLTHNSQICKEYVLTNLLPMATFFGLLPELVTIDGCSQSDRCLWCNLGKEAKRENQEQRKTPKMC